MSGIELGAKAVFKNYLKKLNQPAVEAMVNTAMLAGALLIANEWKRRVPYRTGTYRRSVHIAGHTGMTPGFKGTAIPEPSSKLIVEIGTNITDPPYPVYLEYGTSRMKARPSAGPALDSTVNDALKEIGEAFKVLLVKKVGG